MRPKGSKNGVRTLIERVCQQCGGAFSALPWDVRKGAGKFCCRACKDFSQSQQIMSELFWEYVTKDGPVPVHCPELGPCWPAVRGDPSEAGYRRIMSRGRRSFAHRIAWEITYGPIPAGLDLPITERLFVLHKCDNPPCCNPAHLFLGTLADNNADRDAKGRQATGR